MSPFEENRIVIRVPKLHWRQLLSLKAGLIFLALILSTGFAYWFHAIRPYVWLPGAQIEAPTLPIHSEAAGRILEMGPQEGDFVKQGDPLFALDREGLWSRLQEARHILSELQTQVALENKKMAQVLEDYLTTTTDVEKGLAPEERLSKQLLVMEETQGKSNEATTKLSLAQANVAELEAQIKKLKVLAPFSGVILKRSQNPGAIVIAGEPVYLLCDVNEMWVEAEIAESQIHLIRKGNLARIRLPAYPGKEWKGKVSYIAPATTAKSSFWPNPSSLSVQPVTLPIRISFDRLDPDLKPGLSAQVGLYIGDKGR